MSEFSPTPWRISDGAIVAKDFHWIAQMELTGGEDVHGELLQNANAALIVEAVNNYATLRAELETVKAQITSIEREANNVLYLADNSDFGGSLWTILSIINKKYNDLYVDELKYIESQEQNA